ncbi:MAG TPA: nitrate- and nitrite sensing domain-containing protein [Micromonosporaceae bacterium]|nr:nitrate- and nitrite sensing domain-containing protein [Micromonosporaceae bacterium]
MPIWSKLGLIMIVPTIATIAVGVTGLVQNIGQANDADRARTLAGLSRQAAAAVHELQNERAAAVMLMGLSDADARARFPALTQTTDTAVTAYRQQHDALPVMPTDMRERLDRVNGQIDALPELRKAVTGSTLPLADAMTKYRVFINDLIGIREATAELAGNRHLATDMRSAASLSAMKEYAAMERVVVLNILAQKEITPALYRQFVAATTGREDAQRRFESFSEPWQQVYYVDTVTGPELREASKFEGDIAAVGIADLPDNFFSAAAWDSSIAGVAGMIRKVEAEVDEHVVSDAAAEKNLLQRQVLVQAGVLLGMLLLAILFAWIVARSMARSLRELRHGALTVAQYGLPQAVARLRDPALVAHTSPQQLAAQIAEPLPVRSRDEFGQVAEAFNAVHLEAVRTAAEQAALRASVAGMFVNLARRSQILVDRLIGHLDRLERGEEDPDRLSELFQLDHLATRMRRNDENLLVLAGADSTRIQREPAPFMDVLRAAQSEVEHYTRIEFGTIDRDIEIAAHAVNDLVHLIAELLDNATAFSPPDSAVVVEARRVGDRAVMLVEDRGIGISPDQLVELNERLANPPMVDAAVSRMMGLVVVARLAARHGVKVELRPARERGTVADLTLPAGVLVPRASGGRSIAGMPTAGARDAINTPPRDALGAAPGPRDALAMRPAAPEPRSPMAAPLALESGAPDAGRDNGGWDRADRPTPPDRADLVPPAVGGALGFGAAAATFGNAAPTAPDRSTTGRPPGANGTPRTPSRGLPAWSDLTGANGTDSRDRPVTEPLPQRRSADRWTLDGEAVEDSEQRGVIPRQRPAGPAGDAPDAGTSDDAAPQALAGASGATDGASAPTSAPPATDVAGARPSSSGPAGLPSRPSAAGATAPTSGPPARPTSAPPARPTSAPPVAPTSAPPAVPISAPPAATRPTTPPGQAQPPVWPPVSAPPSRQPSGQPLWASPPPVPAGPAQPAPASAGPGQPGSASAGPGQPGPGQAAGQPASPPWTPPSAAVRPVSASPAPAPQTAGPPPPVAPFAPPAPVRPPAAQNSPPSDHTAELPRVRLDWDPAGNGRDGGQQGRESQQRFVDETMELPIFRELESAWFRTRPPSAAGPSDDAPGNGNTAEPAVAGRDGAGRDGAGRDGAVADADQSTPGPAAQTAPAAAAERRTLPTRPGVGRQGQQPWPGESPQQSSSRPAAERGPADQTTGSSRVGAPAGRPEAVPAPVWQTAADEGWQAAAALEQEQEFSTTETGLPKRVPMSQLVPGGVEKSAATAHRRTPESVRGLLAAYHRGVQRGRTQQPRAGESKTPEPTTAGPQNSQGGKEQER